MTYNTYMEKTPLTYAQAVDAVGLFWSGHLAPGGLAEAMAVIEGRVLAADDAPDFVLPQGPTSLELYNRGY